MGYFDSSSIFPDNPKPSLKGNGHSSILDPDEEFITPHLNKQLWKLRFDKMVKAAKEATAATWAAPVLLAIILGFMVYSDHQHIAQISEQNTKLSALNESLIVLKTQKEDAERQADKDKHEIMVQLDKAETWREALNNKINELKYQKHPTDISQ